MSDTPPIPPASGIDIEWLSGVCPVQAEGTIDGEPFYFRARGARWHIEIGGGNTARILAEEDVAKFNKSKDGSHETPTDARERVERLPVWIYGEGYGDWPMAGYMEDEIARGFIAKGAQLWRGRNAAPPEETP